MVFTRQDNNSCNIVGASCWYAGSPDLGAFWRNILAQRAGFRRIPDERLSLRDYGPDAPESDGSGDRTTVSRAAVIDGFSFDWRKRRIPRGMFVTADLSHWLALDVALAAVEHAGIDFGAVDRQRVAVVVGNSLNGEISRANLLRLRWPFVRQSLLKAFAETGLAEESRIDLVAAAERCFKAPFPEMNEDTLAGSLSNVIAGRIANYLDLRGGAFVVDGACASSLLAIATACDGIASGRWDIVIAGGVDISLDPLELVGFARVGAMTSGEMRVYDERSSGFLPGEGAGFVVIESAASAARFGRRALAIVNGWGLSSDGAGGITAPSAAGQAASMRRAYEQAGYPMKSVDFIEGHGTGTTVGDRVELSAIHDVVGPREPADGRSIGVTSVKTLLGHTKAAAGAAGFIKAVLAVNQRVLPPLPGIDRPHAILRHTDSPVYALASGEIRDPGSVLRAGISGAGFGGINCHITISSPPSPPVDLGGPGAVELLASHQNAELAVVCARSAAELDQSIAELERDCQGISDGELPDLCADAARRLGDGAWRMAVVATSPDDLLGKLARARAALKHPFQGFVELSGGEILIGHAPVAPRVGFLFPGQGAQFLGMGDRLAARFAWARARLDRWDEAFSIPGEDGLRARITRPIARAADSATVDAWRSRLRETRWAQPAVALSALNWAERLERLGVTPGAVAGHSLGELPALMAAGAIDEDELIDILKVRASTCEAEGEPGVMSSLACPAERARGLAAAAPGYCVFANHNAPDRSVIAGAPDAVAAVERAAAQEGIAFVRLDVANAFHSRYMEPAGRALAELGDRISGARALHRPFISGLDGEARTGAIDIVPYISAQVVASVRYVDAITRMASFCDVLVELGPGQVQAHLVKRILGADAAVFAVEPSLEAGDRAFCAAIGQLFARGCPVRMEALFEDRYIRPFVPARDRQFIANPCETYSGADRLEFTNGEMGDGPVQIVDAEPPSTPRQTAIVGEDALAAIRRIVSDLTGYDEDMVHADSRLGANLNLDSIKMAEVAVKLLRLGWSGMRAGLQQDVAVGEIAATMRLEIAAEDGAAVSLAGETEAAGSAPRDLPVYRFSMVWRPVAAPDAERGVPDGGPQLVGEPHFLLFDARHGDQALQLSQALKASGQACFLLPWNAGDIAGPTPAGVTAKRVVALLPEVARDAPFADKGFSDRLGAYLAALGRLLANGVEELLIVGLCPGGDGAILSIDGLGVGATAFLEGLSRQVRVLRLTQIPTDLRALRTPAATPFEYLRLSGQDRLERARLEPVLEWPDEAPGLEDGDLVLVSGGLRGITAECALALADRRRLRFLVIGRTGPETLDEEAANNLRRLRTASADVVYVGCDLADAEAARAAIRPALDKMGVPRGVVHGAGLNLPGRLDHLDAENVAREVRTKAAGLANLLALTDPTRLRLCVGLGSIIAVTGMHGNAGYAMANEIIAAQLAALKAAHPHIDVVCPAFSLWRGVGMGARVGSASLLADLVGVGIDPEIGANAFLDCIGRNNLPLPLVVASPIAGLATWRHLRSAAPLADGRFLTPLAAHESGLALVSRPVLTPALDPYLDHHRFNETRVFPAVFAFEAFVSAAAALGAVSPELPLTISDVEFSRPIAVDDSGLRPIELDARRLAWNPKAVRVVIGEPGRAQIEPIFSGTVAPAAERASGDALFAGECPTDDLSDHLYRDLLFQGPLFQRIERVERLDWSHPVQSAGLFRIRRSPDPSLYTTDPYLLDALLQMAQLLVPQDICLPRAIARVTLGPAIHRAGPALAEARILERTADGYVCRVTAIDPSDGALVARFDGYQVGIVEHRPRRPTLAQLADPIAFDRGRIAEAFSRLREFGLDPSRGLAWSPLGAEGSDDARGRAGALVEQLVAASDDQANGAAALDWDADGGPVLRGSPGRGVSAGVAGGRMVMVYGPAGIACDFRQVRGRSRDASAVRAGFEILPQLTARLGDPDLALTIASAAKECLAKARLHVTGFVIAELDEAGGVLAGVGGGRECRVFVTVLDLALAGRCVLAVLEAAALASIETGAPRELTFRHAFRPTFRDITTIQRTVAAHSFFSWIGEAREMAMASIHAPLADAFGPASGHAMVTNFTEVEVHAPAGFGREIEVTVWLDRVLEEQPSTFELGFRWRRADGEPDAQPPIATARQRLTWVRINDQHVFRPEPFPPFFRDFIDARRLGAESLRTILGGSGLRDTGQQFRFIDERRWRKPPRWAGAARRLTMPFETDLSHSNFVGNIYFSHYGTLFERAALKFLPSLAPDEAWQALCVSSLRIDHLGEARPGDRLEATIELEEIGERSVVVGGAIINRSQGGGSIATGRARLRPLSVITGGAAWGVSLPVGALSVAVA